MEESNGILTLNINKFGDKPYRTHLKVCINNIQINNENLSSFHDIVLHYTFISFLIRCFLINIKSFSLHFQEGKLTQKFICFQT